MPDYHLVNDLTLLILLAGVFCALGVIVWRGQVQAKKTKQEIRNIKKQVDASFSLSGYLLEAHNEEAVVLGQCTDRGF